MAKGAVLYGFGEPLRVEELELKPPRAGEIVVKMVASGVCHSDLSVQQGKLPVPPPCVLGHEGAGIVEELGKDVEGLRKGDHVVLAWVQSCGACHHCFAGRGHLCEAGLRGAMMGEENVFTRNGMDVSRFAGVSSFADYSVVRATAAIKVDDDVPLDKACLVGCGVMTGVGAAVNTAAIRPGETVAVFGCGGVGLNVVQGAALCGASRVIAVDLFPAKLELAKTFGATDTLNAKEVGDVAMAIKELTGGLGVDYAFDVIGSAAVVSQCFPAIKRGGKIVVVGVPPFGQELTVPGLQFVLEEKSLIGSLYGSGALRRDMPRLIDLYQRGRLKLDELISRRIKLEQVNEALTAMEKGEVARSVIVY